MHEVRELRALGGEVIGVCRKFRHSITLGILVAYIFIGKMLVDAIGLEQTKPTELSSMDILKLAMESEEARLKAEAERDHAIATKAQIGSRREATAMASASSARREVARLREELGVNQRHATIIAVENAARTKFGAQVWRRLKDWCDQRGVIPSTATDPRWGIVKAWPADAWMAVAGVDLSRLFPGRDGFTRAELAG